MLRRVCGPLGDAMLATSGWDLALEALAQQNRFVEPERDHPGWFRPHPLFAEFLQAELRRTEPGLELVLHRRAASWLAENGYAEDAVRHAIAGGDHLVAARLVTGLAQPLINDGRLAVVRGWVQELGDTGARAYPPLAVIAAWVWALDGDADAAQRSLATAESMVFDGRPTDGTASLSSGIHILRAVTAPRGVDQMLLDAQHVVALEPPGSPWHPVGSMLLGTAQLLRSRPDDATKAFRRAADLGRDRQRGAASVALAQLALLAVDVDPVASADLAGDALDVVRQGGLQDHPASVLAYAAGALVATLDGETAPAHAHCADARRLAARSPVQVVFPWLTTQAALVLGRTLMELDDVPGARSQLDVARAQVSRMQTRGTLPDQVSQLAAELSRRGDRAREAGVVPLTHAELRVLRLMPTYLSLADMAEQLGVSRNTVKTQAAAVYRKLQATTRADAVRRGRELDLL